MKTILSLVATIGLLIGLAAIGYAQQGSTPNGAAQGSTPSGAAQQGSTPSGGPHSAAQAHQGTCLVSKCKNVATVPEMV